MKQSISLKVAVLAVLIAVFFIVYSLLRRRAQRRPHHDVPQSKLTKTSIKMMKHKGDTGLVPPLLVI